MTFMIRMRNEHQFGGNVADEIRSLTKIYGTSVRFIR